MTTSVKIHVNGRYRATVKQDDREPIIVEGNYVGSPNPSGEHTLYVCHPVNTSLRITEEPVPEESPAAAPAAPIEAPASDAQQTA